MDILIISRERDCKDGSQYLFKYKVSHLINTELFNHSLQLSSTVQGPFAKECVGWQTHTHFWSGLRVTLINHLGPDCLLCDRQVNG